MEKGTGTTINVAVASVPFISVIREGGDAYTELGLASSPVGGGEVESSR